MIDIKTLTSNDFDKWREVFSQYWKWITNNEVTQSQIQSCEDFILNQFAKEEIDIISAFENNKLIGFCIYQIDSEDKEWCEFEGFGFIRETFVLEQYRHHGIATKIIKQVLTNLQKQGVKNVYLDSHPDSLGFWETLGFITKNDISSLEDEQERMFKEINK